MTVKNRKKSCYHVLKGMELLENRCLLSASPIEVGTVYYEGAGTEAESGSDTAPDYIYVSFQGGAEGTEMTQVTIDMARWDDGSYCFIDQGQGVYGYSPFQILDSTDYNVTGYTISEDSTQVTVNLDGFTAGDVLVISCDVDQVITGGSRVKTVAVAEGGEYEMSSTFKATFEHENYYALNIEDELGYVDDFSTIPELLDIEGLPDETYTNEYSIGANGEDQCVYTAAAFESAIQVPLPCTLSGNVWEDVLAEGKQYQEGIDDHLENVEIQLYKLNETTGKYELSQTKFTDENGHYEFDVEEGTYRVLEIQPDGYLDMTSFVGTVDGVEVGTQISVNELSNITLFGGDDSIENNFSEYRVCTLSGNVWEDMTATGTQYREGIDQHIEGVEIQLYKLNTNTYKYELIETDYTDKNGHYSFELTSGTYRVVEIQPDGYKDVTAFVGTVDGTEDGTWISVNELSDIALLGGDDSIQNNFSEYRPCEISGKVWLDINKNDEYDAGIDELLEGVQIDLMNEYGTVIDTMYTDEDGYYEFTDLMPDEYQVYEHQPEEYDDGGERVGTVDGETRGTILANDHLGNIELYSSDVGIHYDFWEFEYEKCSISGYVFQDGDTLKLTEGDDYPSNLWELYPGARDATDTPIANVTLILQDSDGNEVARTTTDSNGYYEFTNLNPGQYQIYEVHPTDYKDGIDTPGYFETEEDSRGESLVPDGDLIYNVDLNYGDDGVEYNFSEIKVVWEKKPDNPPGGDVPSITPPVPVYHSGGGSAPVIGNSYSPYFGSSTGLSLGGSGGGGASFHLAVLGAAGATGLADAGAAGAAGVAGVAGAAGAAGMNGEVSILTNRNGSTTAYANASALAAQANMNAYANYSRLSDIDASMFDPNTWEGRALIRVRQMLAEGLDPNAVWSSEDLDSAKLLAGDFDGNGKDEFAIFTDGFWFIDLNGNLQWDDFDLWVKLGSRGDQAIVGDWNGDGKADIGVFGTPWDSDRDVAAHEYGLPDAENQRIGTYKNIPVDNKGYYYVKEHRDGVLRRDVVDHVFEFGKPGDIAVAGDWNGDGVSSVGVYNNGKWTIDYDGDGRFTSADKEYVFGEPGDIPVVGKWDHSEVSKIGVYRNGEFLLDVNGKGVMDSSVAHVQHRVPNGRPVIGDFTGSGVSDIAASLPGNAESVATVPSAPTK